jgi:hypothetical protein
MSDSVGEFSLEHTGSVYERTDNGFTSHASFSGPATGYGAVFGTLSFPLPAQGETPEGGPCGWVGQAFLEGGTNLAGIGDGTWEQIDGAHRWKISMLIEVSNGDRLRSEGEVDLETLMYKGQLYEAD